MRKWALANISIGLVFGISLLLLGITNVIHHLFESNIEITSTSIGIAISIGSLLVFIYYKKYPGSHGKHPNTMITGFCLIMIGGTLFLNDISLSLLEPQFVTGCLVLGFLELSFFLIIGGLSIIESLRIYFEERRLKLEEEVVGSSKWGNT